jgi:hypothetical protein
MTKIYSLNIENKFIQFILNKKCPKWRDSRELFGCFGENINEVIRAAKDDKQTNDIEALTDLCNDLHINDADRLWQRDDQIFVWRGIRFWRIADFPKAPRVINAGPSPDIWTGFFENPDAVVIIQEGIVEFNETFRQICLSDFFPMKFKV